MAFCGNCGMQLNDEKFCPQCGTPVAAPADQEQPEAQAQKPELQTAVNDFTAKIAAFNDTADTTADFDPEDIKANKFMAVLSYLSLLVLIPIFAAPNSKYARYHANQGLNLAIVTTAYWIVYAIVRAVIMAISWRLYIITVILALPGLASVVWNVLGIVNAVTGTAKELPFIGKYRILK